MDRTGVVALQHLGAEHGPSVLDFELANRAYFARFVTDRGDDFFVQFAQRHRVLLAEQDAGVSAYYLLLDRETTVLGRFNLYEIGGGTARLGYRVGEHVAGRGTASAAVREICRPAVTRHALATLTAATSEENIGSQRVLSKAGFAAVGPASPADLGGKQGTLYRRDLLEMSAG